MNEELELQTLTQEITASQVCLAQQFAFLLDTRAHGCEGTLHSCNRINFSATEMDP